MNPLNSNNHSNDDNVEAQLRSALNTEAAMVNPAADGLTRIRAGIDEQRAPVWWRSPAIALAAAAVIGLAVAGGTVALNNSGGDSNNVVGTQRTPTATPPADTPSPLESPSSAEPTSATEEPAAFVTVPVYYVQDVGTGVRLFREFHSTPLIDGDRIRSAVTEMFTGKPQDPDYTSAWSTDARVNRVTRSGDTVTIDLNGAATESNVGSAAADVTLQQLVYTATAADKSVRKVKLTVDGESVSELWGHVSVGTKAFQRAPMVDVQGLIWLLSPQEGERVRRTVAIAGYGTAFEGTISWQVLGTGRKVVAEGFTQGGANGEFGEFADSVTLQPGTYEVRAFESSAEDGRPLNIDDKTFTVE